MSNNKILQCLKETMIMIEIKQENHTATEEDDELYYDCLSEARQITFEEDIRNDDQNGRFYS